MKITIKDIARMAGVSIATVSRVINNSKPVNEDVRMRVLKAMEQTNFLPNAMARNLAKNKSYLLGVMIPDVKNTVLDDLIHGINHVSELYGYNTMLSLTSGMLENELHYFNKFREIQADGIILASDYLKENLITNIKQTNIPCILVGRDRSDAIPSVHIDNITAAYEAVTYLIQQGHRKIGMLRLRNEDIASGYHRYQGYAQALTEAGITINGDWVIECGVSVEDGMMAMRKICETTDIPTAIFCATDRIAIGAINYLYERGLSVPDDISIYGFDGIDMASIIRPKLSTVKYSATEIGMTAARNLIKLIKGETITPRHWVIPHYLKNRESVRLLK
ncbi:LacI family DNA-binding transcriptional regulator [Terrilactibacillus sp. BCM23-1]|uniref:LacI family DNA-binding transcriptional regulator n=1 Tax=Terrilactibacillus tamarindi TaxID=2599694 RepID=A0A6N8CNQ3_9BACI|nr:LacI family DNA-binding transcriptional regulator [Terrilactibacillus tamarindi]MTT31769.1 LacI family DNA-binding transcriptional regulator [Terrilactibacillus tamarindi]